MSNVSGKYFLPFFSSMKDMLEQFGVTDITRKELKRKEKLEIENDVSIIIGLTDDIQGNIAYSMDTEAAFALAGAMMGGEDIQELNDITKSALSELANMAAANATIALSHEGKTVDISPPTMIFGQDLLMIISQVQTVSLTMATSVGPVQVNVGLETVL